MDTFPGPTSNRFVSQRLRLNYVDWGNPDAPLLILQHGGRDHCRSWDWVADELRHDWHVIAPDLRGHGDSDWSPEGNYSLDAFLYDFAQLVHTLDHEQVSIIAHSLGGNIATRFAGLYPEKVRRLINIEGLGPRPDLSKEDSSIHRLKTWIDDKRASAGRTVRRYATLGEAYRRMKMENSFLSDEQAQHLTIHGATRNEDGTWSWKFDNYLNILSVRDMTFDQKTELWRTIQCPVLLLWGKDSFFKSPREDGRIDYFPTASLIEYENAGHWLHHDQFDRFMNDVQTFL
jgi:pimeloyl-ACP methyl ester carboxylesterase